jgi:hypothetical protein
MNRFLVKTILSSMLICLVGCSSGEMVKSYTRENTSLGYVKTVAVLPFEGGNTQRIREFAMTQMLTSGVFDVVDKGRVDIALQREVISPGAPIDPGTLKRLGRVLKVEAFIFGSVEQKIQSRGNARYPEVVMTLRLIDSETGTLLWQATGRGSGYSLADRLFGLAPKDEFLVTMDLLRELIDTIE